MIKPKTFKQDQDDEDGRGDEDDEDYENDEDRPGYESEPEAIEIEDEGQEKEKSKSVIAKEKQNNRKREIYNTEMVYLKNGMDEAYEMDVLPSWYTPEKDNLWKHDGSQSP